MASTRASVKAASSSLLASGRRRFAHAAGQRLAPRANGLDFLRQGDVVTESSEHYRSLRRHIFVLSSFDVLVFFLIVTGCLTFFSRFNLGTNICFVINLVALVIVRLKVNGQLRDAIVCIAVMLYCSYTVFTVQKSQTPFENLSAVPFIFLLTGFRLIVLLSMALGSVAIHFLLSYALIDGSFWSSQNTAVIVLANTFMLVLYLLVGMAFYSTFFALQELVETLKRQPLLSLRHIPKLRELERDAFSDLPVALLLNPGQQLTQEQYLFVLLRLSQHSEFRDAVLEVMRPTAREAQSTDDHRATTRREPRYYRPSAIRHTLSSGPFRAQSRFSASSKTNLNVEDIKMGYETTASENSALGMYKGMHVTASDDTSIEDLRQFLRSALIQFFLETHPNRRLCSQLLQSLPFLATRQQIDAGLASYNAHRCRGRKQRAASPRICLANQLMRLWTSSDPRQRPCLPNAAADLQVPKSDTAFTLYRCILEQKKAPQTRCSRCLSKCCSSDWFCGLCSKARMRRSTAVLIAESSCGPFLLPNRLSVPPSSSFRGEASTSHAQASVFTGESESSSTSASNSRSQNIEKKPLNTLRRLSRFKWSSALDSIPSFAPLNQITELNPSQHTQRRVQGKPEKTSKWSGKPTRIIKNHRPSGRSVGQASQLRAQRLGHNLKSRGTAVSLSTSQFDRNIGSNSLNPLDGSSWFSTPLNETRDAPPRLRSAERFSYSDTLSPYRISVTSQDSAAPHISQSGNLLGWYSSLDFAALYKKQLWEKTPPVPRAIAVEAEKHKCRNPLRGWYRHFSPLMLAVFGLSNTEFRVIMKDSAAFQRQQVSKQLHRKERLRYRMSNLMFGSDLRCHKDEQKIDAEARRPFFEVVRSSLNAFWHFRLNASYLQKPFTLARTNNGIFRDTKIERWYIVWATYSEAFLASKLHRTHKLLVFFQILLYMLSAGVYKWALAELPLELLPERHLETLLLYTTCVIHLFLLGYIGLRNQFSQADEHDTCHLFKIRNAFLALFSFFVAEINFYLDTTGTLPAIELSDSVCSASCATFVRGNVLILLAIALKEAASYLSLLMLPLLCICSELTTGYITGFVVTIKFVIGPIIGVLTKTWPANTQAKIVNNYSMGKQSAVSYRLITWLVTGSTISLYVQLFPLVGPCLIFYYIVARAIQTTLRQLFARTVLFYLLFLDAVRPAFYLGDDEYSEDSKLSSNYVERENSLVPNAKRLRKQSYSFFSSTSATSSVKQ